MISKLKQSWQNPKYNKLTAVLFVLAFSVIGIFAVSSYAAVDPFHPDGTLVRDTMGTATNYGDDKIYLIQAGKKRPIDDQKILLSQGYNTSLIKNATDADLRLPVGEKVQFREGTLVLGPDSLPYVIDTTTYRFFGFSTSTTNSRNVLDNYTALSAMGYTGELLMALYAGKITNNFPAKGLPIKNQSIHYDGTFVRNGNEFYIIENDNMIGKAYKRPIPNPDNKPIPNIIKSYDYGLRSGDFFSNSKIKQATADDLALGTATKPLDFREGTLIKGPDGIKYVVDYNDSSGAVSLRAFSTDDSFKSLGYTDQELITVGSDVISQYQAGAKIEFSNIIAPPNKPPVASVTAAPTAAYVSESFNFDGTASADPDGKIVKYTWNFGDDQMAEGVKIAHSYSKAATYKVTLTVTDDKGLIGTQSTDITVKEAVAASPTAPVAPPSAGSAGAGYVIWDNATWSPEHLAGMQRQKPGMIRWAVTWDRHLADETKHLINPFDGFKTVSWPAREPTWHGTDRNTEADKFFKQLKASCSSNYGGTGFDINNESSWGSYDAKRCTTLVVSQHGVKAGPWDWPASIGACPSGPASTCHWPDFSSGKMASYMQELYDILRGYLPKDKIVWEDYNEADLRWGSKNQAVPFQPGADVNYSDAWNPIQKGGYGYTYGTAPYTGGTGSNWVKMHQLVKDKVGSTTPIPYASGALVYKYNYEPENATNCPLIPGGNVNFKYCSNEDWIKATAPLVSYSSLHLYGDYNYMTDGPIAGRPGSDFVSVINENLDVWKNYKGFDMPFYIGETGPTSDTNVSNLALNKPQSIALAERNTFLQDAKLSPRTAGKYMGLTYLGFVGKYRVDPWKTRYGWWDSRFDPDDVVTVN